MKFGVITKIPDRFDGGNLASAIGQVFVQIEEPSESNGYLGTYQDVGYPAALALRHQVFHLGEVLILDDDGRELPYPGRKPSKWSVECEEFDDVERAVARAREVMNA